MASPVPEPKYKFVNGNGDDTHAAAINSSVKDGYHVVQMVFNPDSMENNKRLIVLMQHN